MPKRKKIVKLRKQDRKRTLDISPEQMHLFWQERQPYLIIHTDKRILTREDERKAHNLRTKHKLEVYPLYQKDWLLRCEDRNKIDFVGVNLRFVTHIGGDTYVVTPYPVCYDDDWYEDEDSFYAETDPHWDEIEKENRKYR